MIRPFRDSATRRRDDRQAIRNALGVSRDPAPTFRAVVRAVQKMQDLVYTTTGGRYRLVLEKRQSSYPGTVPQEHDPYMVPGWHEVNEDATGWLDV